MSNRPGGSSLSGSTLVPSQRQAPGRSASSNPMTRPRGRKLMPSHDKCNVTEADWDKMRSWRSQGLSVPQVHARASQRFKTFSTSTSTLGTLLNAERDKPYLKKYERSPDLPIGEGKARPANDSHVPLYGVGPYGPITRQSLAESRQPQRRRQSVQTSRSRSPARPSRNDFDDYFDEHRGSLASVRSPRLESGTRPMKLLIESVSPGPQVESNNFRRHRTYVRRESMKARLQSLPGGASRNFSRRDSLTPSYGSSQRTPGRSERNSPYSSTSTPRARRDSMTPTPGRSDRFPSFSSSIGVSYDTSRPTSGRGYSSISSNFTIRPHNTPRLGSQSTRNNSTYGATLRPSDAFTSSSRNRDRSRSPNFTSRNDFDDAFDRMDHPSPSISTTTSSSRFRSRSPNITSRSDFDDYFNRHPSITSSGTNRADSMRVDVDR